MQGVFKATVSALALAAVNLGAANAAVVTVSGGDGSNGANGSAATGGTGSNGSPGQDATADAGYIAPNGDVSNIAFSTAGDGGNGGNGNSANGGSGIPGAGARGGFARGFAQAGDNLAPGQFAQADAHGGQGGDAGLLGASADPIAIGADGGDGGGAVGSAVVFPTGAATTSAIVNVYGGDGGDGIGAGHKGGNGGDVLGDATILDDQQTALGRASASVNAVGGDGGFGRLGANGGRGGDAIIDKAVSATWAGALALSTDAIGGDGGGTSQGSGGSGGQALAITNGSSSQSAGVIVRSVAVGGDGGGLFAQGALIGGNGGDAYAESNAAAPSSGPQFSQQILASANATGGSAGQGLNARGAAGDATAIANASSNRDGATPIVSAKASAGSTQASFANGGYVQGAGGSATARATGQSNFSTQTSANSSATGGALATAQTINTARSMNSVLGASTANEGVSQLIRVSGQYFTNGVHLNVLNSTNLTLTGTAHAGSISNGYNGEDFYLNATSIVDPVNVGAPGSLVQKFANDPTTVPLGQLAFFGSADTSLDPTLGVTFSSSFDFVFDSRILEEQPGDYLKIGFENVIASGNAFDLLQISIQYDFTTILDVVFNSYSEFQNFFTNGFWQTALPLDYSRSVSSIHFFIDYAASNAVASLEGAVVQSLFSQELQGNAFGFNLFLATGSQFVPSGGPGGPSEIPLPAAFPLMLFGLGALCAVRLRCAGSP